MNNKLLQLDYIMNIDKFQTIQDDLAKATDMAVITIDYKGHPITAHSYCSDFCNYARNDPTLSKYCEKCDSRGGIEAARAHNFYIYKCHFNIVDLALPIIIKDQYIGALMAGQVRLLDDHEELERIVSKDHTSLLTKNPILHTYYEKLPIMSLDKIESIASMMYHVIHYIVDEAVLKTSLYELNQRLTNFSSKYPEFNYKNFQPDEALASHENDIYLYYSTDTSKSKDASLVKPAIEYIQANSDQKLYIEDMAKMCNISTSYFSRLFKKEVGDNFSNYVNKLRVIRAKELLETTIQPIINISLEVGFEDCGYFIKVFKKHFQMTPATYRKNLS